MNRGHGMLAQAAASQWFWSLEQATEAVHFSPDAFPQKQPRLRNNNEETRPCSVRAAYTPWELPARGSLVPEVS